MQIPDGKSEGFGNPISIQTVAIVKAAKAAGGVYSPNKERYVQILLPVVRLIPADSSSKTWPVCHVSDNSTLFIRILHGILAGENIGSGKGSFGREGTTAGIRTQGADPAQGLYIPLASIVGIFGFIGQARRQHLTTSCGGNLKSGDAESLSKVRAG